MLHETRCFPALGISRGGVNECAGSGSQQTIWPVRSPERGAQRSADVLLVRLPTESKMRSALAKSSSLNRLWRIAPERQLRVYWVRHAG